MTLNRNRIFFVALGCGLVFSPATVFHAQQASSAPQAQTGLPAQQDQEVDPLKRERSDKEKPKRLSKSS